MDFADGFRIGLPFFLPIDPGYDTRIQLVDNLSFLAGDHLLKVGVEYNHTGVGQQFIGFANGLYKFSSVDGFMNFVTQGNRYVTCSDGSDSPVGTCPEGATITGPVLLYSAGAHAGKHAAGPVGAAGFYDGRTRALHPGHVAPPGEPDAEPGPALGGLVAPGNVHRTGGHLLRPVDRELGLPLGRDDSRRPRQLPAALRTRLGSPGRWAHARPSERGFLLLAHPDAGVRAAPHDQRGFPGYAVRRQRRDVPSAARRGSASS